MRKSDARAYIIWGVLLFFQEGVAASDAQSKKETVFHQQIDVTSSLKGTTSPIANLYVTDREFEEAVRFLGQLVAIPSVSNPNSPDYTMEHLTSAARCIERKLNDLGFNVSCPSIEGSAPFIIAEWVSDLRKPTLLLYAHYDVQPVDREKWISNPFIMEERDGRLYGRGASDDKAGIIAIITALEAYLKSVRELPVNVKLLFEGEEEYGSSHMKTLLKQRFQDLQADALIVLDGLNRDIHTGTLTSSTRGLVNIHLKINALEKPVHSGIGCLVPDPAQALAGLIYSLRDPKAIPGFMDNCQVLSNQEREILARDSQSSESYAKEMGVVQSACLRGNPKESIYERIVQEPSISVVNMHCGQPNGGNSIQESASCTIGIRLTPGQDPDQIVNAVINYLESQAKVYNLPIEVHPKEKGSWPWKADLAGPFSKQYFEALGENFRGISAMPIGGALPLLRDFQEIFPSMEMIVPAVEDPHTSAHSHNESQDLTIFRNSINALIAFFYKAGQMPRTTPL